MAFDYSSLIQVAGAASQAAGAVQQFRGASQLGASAEEMLKAGAEEAAATIREGQEIERTARQRAWASIQDAAFLRQQTVGRINQVQQEAERIQARIEAQAAGSGIEFSGSPVAVAAESALAAQQEIENQRLTETIGVKQFLFDAEESLLKASEAKAASGISEAAIRRLRGSQAGVLSRQSQAAIQGGFSALLGGVITASKLYGNGKLTGGSSLSISDPGGADY